MNYKYLLYAIVTAAALFSGCGDKKNNNPVVPESDDKYTLTLNVNPEQGEVSVRPPRDDDDGYRAGELVEATATAKSGYAFICWSGASTDSNKVTSFIMTGDMELTAKFGLIRTLNFESLPFNSGSVSVNPQKDVYLDGARVTITATAKQGYIFDYWDGLENSDVGDDKDSVVTITLNRDREIFARFVNGYTLTINIEPEDAGDVELVDGIEKTYYREDDEVSVMATARTGFRFINWTLADGTSSTSRIRNVVFSKNDVVLTANFEPIDPTPILTQGED